MSSSRLDRPIPIVVPGPAFRPIEGGDKKKRRRHSPVTDPNDDEKDCMLANIALEYHNMENGTSYELAGAFLLNTEFILDGAWAHCNFAAMQPSQDMNAKPPRTLFFAEMHRDDDTTCHWTVMACIVLEGNTTVGCSSCSEVIHPTHGFTQGHRKPKFSVQPTTCSLASYNKHELSKNKALEPSALRRMHAEDALELYNSKNGANYKLVDAFLSKDLLSDGSWFHCNFTAKQPNEDDIPPKHFFAEIYSGDAYAPIFCFILEGQTTDRCSWCSGVLHPTHGFRSRVCKYSVATYLPLWFRPIKHRPTSSLQQTTYSTASYSLYAFLQDPERRKAYYDEMSKRTLADYVRPKAMEPCILHRKHAEDALEQYNRKNGANYEVVDTLVSEDLLSDTTWYHINFTAKPPNEDMDPKHFFAEIYSGDAYSPGDCLMLEEGETTKDCTFCSEVIHPTRGFTSKVRKYGPGAVKGPEYKPNLPSAVN